MYLQSIVGGLNLRYDPTSKQFIGVGYKSININKFFPGRTSYYDKQGKYRTKKIKPEYVLNKWYEARGTQDSTMTAMLDRREGLDGPVYDTYFPGFHIFQNREAAICYDTSSDYQNIVRVEYRDVTSIGMNSFYNWKDTVQYPATAKRGRNYWEDIAVVARYMRIVAIIETAEKLLECLPKKLATV